MAKINPRDISRDTECYAAVEWEVGFRCGRVKDGKLYSLENPNLYMIMPNNPRWILAAFETQEELMQWRAEVQGAPKSEPKVSVRLTSEEIGLLLGKEPEEVKTKNIGSEKNMLQEKAEQANLKFKIQQAENFALHLKAVNLKIRIDEGLVYFELNTKHTEPWPFTSFLFQQMIDDGAVLEHSQDLFGEGFVLYADRSKKEILASGNTFIALLGVLADRMYRKNMQKEHEASLDPSLTYISKGNPKKKQPPFILSQIL